jgi:hypothetical protein
MPFSVPHRLGVVMSPTMTSGLSPLNVHEVVQQELSVPLFPPSSQSSPAWMTRSPQAAAAGELEKTPTQARHTRKARV